MSAERVIAKTYLLSGPVCHRRYPVRTAYSSAKSGIKPSDEDARAREAKGP